jgi:5-methylcytosine-specific restriction endonuclease McrA
MADLWQADHINPVFRGGGKVKSPAELRCLCLKCHKEITKQQAGQRARQGKSYKVFE